MGVCGLICVGLGVPDLKKLEIWGCTLNSKQEENS